MRYMLCENGVSSMSIEFPNDLELVSEYKVYKSYQVSIYESAEQSAFFYVIEPLYDLEPTEQEQFDNIAEVIEKDLGDSLSKNIEARFQFTFSMTKKITERYLTARKLPNEWLFPLIFSILNLETLGPLLLDSQLNEIYLDTPSHPIYVDHQTFGRCKTAIYLSSEEIDGFLTKLSLDSDQSVSFVSPSLKTELKTDYFHVRVTIDVPPLAVDGIHLDLRKLHEKYFDIFELLENNTLNSHILAFLILILRLQASLTIVGVPASGKTTLQNALLQLLPSYWRVVSIEDVVESPKNLPFHFLRLKVSPFEDERQAYTKQSEAVKLLHRTPDYLNLGEISTPDHAKALFQALSSGIPSIQTIHGASFYALDARLEHVFGIPIALLSLGPPHIFVEIGIMWKKSAKIRKVLRVGELVPLLSDAKQPTVSIQPLFELDDDMHTYKVVKDPFSSYVLKTLSSYHFLNNTRIKELLESIEHEIEQLKQSSSKNLSSLLQQRLDNLFWNLT